MVRALFKCLKWLILSVILLVVLGFGALTLWVATGPRSLDALTPYITKALAPPGSSYQVKIGRSELIWDGFTHPVAIHAKNVEVLGANGATLAHFPEVGVRLYFFKLIFGDLDVKSIELLNPVAKLVEDEQGNITSFGFSDAGGGPDTSLEAALVMLTAEPGDNPVTHLKSFIIRRAALSVLDYKGNAFLSSPSASIEITRASGVATGRMVMPLEFDGKRSEIDSHFTIDGNHKTLSSNIVFSDVPSGVLHALAPSQKWMDGVKLPLSGYASVHSDFDAHIDSIDFSTETGAGTVDFPDQIDGTLAIRHVKLQGTLSDHLNTFTVKDMLIDFGTHSLKFQGVARRQGDDYGVDGYAETGNISVEDVHRYWPLKLAPHTRRWVTTRLSKGRVIKATAKLHYPPGDFKIKNTPDADIDSTITVKGMTISYKSSHPPITDIDGEIRFTGKTMDAKISSAKYLSGTHVTSAHLRFPDFYPDDVRLFIDLELDATARDVQHFLALPDMNKAAKLNLTPDVTGEATGSAKLDFIAFSENDKDDVGATGRINYTISANLKNVAQKRFLGNRDVADADMKLNVDNKGIKLAGRAKINDVPMGIELESSFGAASETTYKIRADMPIARLPDFGLPHLDFAKGTLGADATFVSSDTVDKSSVSLDLTHAEINLPQHGFIKKDGDRATLDLTTDHLPNGNTLIRNFTYRQDGDTASGTAEYDHALQDFSHFSFAPLKVGNQDLAALNYAKSGNTITLTANGKRFDAAPYLADKPSKATALSYIIDLRAGQLILGDDRVMSEVAVQADCPPDACRSAHIAARLKDGTPFAYNISGGKLESSCANAGELVRTLNILDTIGGGKMIMKGQYNADKLEGTLEVTDYTIKHAPVMTKILTVASLTGIVDTLAGNGIYFSKLTAPFVYHNGIVILKEAKSHGSALGLTADGVIDTNKSTLDLTGLLVPSYTLNSLVGNIPILGNIITGGSGKGLVALSYGVHGDMKDPSIRVNPLSVLTPGFLRDVFTMFDKPAPDMDAVEAAQKKTAAQGAQPAAPGNTQPVTPAPVPVATPVPVISPPATVAAPPAKNPAAYPSPPADNTPLPSLEGLKQ